MSGTKGSNNLKKSKKVSTSVKKRIQLEGSGEYQSKLSLLFDRVLLTYSCSVRASPRIRTMGRSISYANLDGGSGSDHDEYLSEEDPQEEEEFRPFKRSRGQMGFRQKSSSYTQSSNKVRQFI